VPSPADNAKAPRQGFWPSIARIFVVEILALLVLSAAVVGYVNWSSEAAWAEFIAASKLAAPAANLPVLSVKGKRSCTRT
jgi:hypothetical protein